MKYLITICTIAVISSFSAHAKNRSVSGQFIYAQTKKPARKITLYYNFPRTYPSFFVFFVSPRPGDFYGKVITDKEGRFKIETKNKRLLTIQPVLAKQSDDVVVVDLKDSLAINSSDASKGVVVFSAVYLTGEQGDLYYYIDGIKVYNKRGNMRKKESE